MRSPSIAARMADKLRSFGWADTVWFAVDALLRAVSFGRARLVKYYFVAQPVAKPATEPMRGTTMRLYVTSTLDEVVEQAPRPLATLHDRFAQHARCVVAERDGRLAGFIWLCPPRYREDAVRCEYGWTPDSAAVWDFDVYIEPSQRMGRLFVRLWAWTHGLLAQENVRWTLSRIDAFNPGSLAAHRKLGASVIARAWFLSIGAVQLTVASVAPYCHLSLTDRSGPNLHFDLSRLERAGARTP